MNKSQCFIIAELSANHNGSLDKALLLVSEAAKAGADAIKLQTYTADTITLNCDNKYFHIKNNSQWDGQSLYSLYEKAYTPWEWHQAIKDKVEDLGLVFLSTPFDFTAVDFLEDLGVSLYKIASFEVVDIPLIERVASTQKPIIMSTGMATKDEIQEALDAIKAHGNHDVTLLKCVSNYPAKAEDLNINSMAELREHFKVKVGLSDHSLSHLPSILAVALGAVVIEKHFILNRDDGGADCDFSLEPHEFSEMVKSIREAEEVLGSNEINPSDKLCKNRVFRKSLFISCDVKAGDYLSAQNVRSVRPSYGMSPKYYQTVLGKRFIRDLKKGTPLSFEDIE